MTETAPDPTQDLVSVFERRESIDAIDGLMHALTGDLMIDENNIVDMLPKTAIGIDTNILLLLSMNPRGCYSAIDYLSRERDAPFILPGQVIQEFWNNIKESPEGKWKEMKKKFEEFKDSVEQLSGDAIAGLKVVEDALSHFSREHSEIYSPLIVSNAAKVMNELRDTAVVPFCPRSIFRDIYRSRNSTKTPPGFKDDGDGDFFVWADFLYGLRGQQVEGSEFQHVVFVTNDKKVDWVIDDSAHPILISEVRSLLQVSFEIWNFNKLIKMTKPSVLE